MKTKESILRAIAYFDGFHYPLTAEEIYLFMGQSVTPVSLSIDLKCMVEERSIFQLGIFYSLHNKTSLAERRIAGNQKAVELLRIAYRIGRSLYRFPFVRGIGISGSLSKNYADSDADIDFFIITSRNHLWIARTFLHTLKKLSFLVGKQDWYCMNYFVDEEALVIAEKNIFTATEVVTLKPVCGKTGLDAFYKANNWTADYFPNQSSVSVTEIEEPAPWFKKITESIFTNAMGKWLDDCLMRITARRWKTKENNHKLNRKGNLLALIADKHFARPNPQHFQQKILENLDERLKGILVDREIFQ